MARAVRDFRYAEYLALAARSGGDIERMSPPARKAYLRHRLRVIETELQHIARRLDRDLLGAPRDYSSSPAALAEKHWTSVASLSYLLAAREILKKTIATL